MNFQKFIYQITHKEIRRKLFFPVSKTSSVKVEKLNDSFKKKDFFDLSNQFLKPFLKSKGFIGENDIYVKETINFYNRIVIASSKSGKVFCVNCEIKKKAIDKVEILEIESFPTNFDFWKRISPDKFDNWWFTSNSKEKNILVLKEIIKLIEFEGFPFFNKNNKKLK